MTIYLFDFDNTIVKLPYKESLNYMDTDESLNPELPFKLIRKTKEDYKQAVKNNDGPILLLSNRVVGVRKALEITLGVFGYTFDDYFLIEDEDRSKGNRLKRILKKYPHCTNIKYWEDKDKHIQSIEQTLEDYPNIVLEIIKTDI